MKIGILETGPVVPELVPRHGSYGAIITRFLRQADPQVETFAIAVHELEPLPDIRSADGWVISGSKHGAYDDLPWIAPLEAFLRHAVAARVPVAGICFGHQILAQALGGRVEKSHKGWGLGPTSYALTETPEWMGGAGADFTGTAVHQDQVVAVPPDAHVIASSEFCPIAALAYGDRDRPYAVTVQPHPEFDTEFSRDLLEIRRGDVFPAEQTDTALSELQTPNHNRDWARWMISFFRAATETG